MFNMSLNSILVSLALMALPLIFAVTLHEAAHGFVARKFGDNTAYMLGRVTLNPIKHIDPLGTIILPVIMLILSRFTFMFGWAKPVPVNWRNLRNPRRDMALVALAGPFANLLMAFAWAGIVKLSILANINSTSAILTSTANFFKYSGLLGIQFNVLLMLLNLIPIPPLDGSRVISAILSPRLASAYATIEPYGIWILLGFLFLFGFRFLHPAVTGMTQLIMRLFNII